MATTSATSPGTVVSDSTVGTEVWSNPGNATASDDSRATCTVGTGSGTVGEYLKATNFGFSIPSGATIDGITVDVELSATQVNRVSDNAVRIVKGGTIGSTDKSNGATWPTTDTSRQYGGVSDLWGETWAYSDINASTFGFCISPTASGGGTRDARVDHITITIDYTESGTEYTQSVAGTLTTAGTAVKKTSVDYAGAISPAGAILKSVATAVAGTLTTAGALVKQTAVSVAGTLTTAGTVAGLKKVFLALAGAISPAGTVVKKTQTAVVGVLTTAGTIARKTAVSVAGTLTTVGAVVKKTMKTLQGAISPGGTIATKLVFVLALAGSITPAGGLVRKTGKALAGAATSAGALVRKTAVGIGGTLTTAGTIVKKTAILLQGLLTSAGALATNLISGVLGTPYELTLYVRNNILKLKKRNNQLSLNERDDNLNLEDRT